MSRTGIEDDRCYQSQDKMDLGMDGWLWSIDRPKSQQLASTIQDARLRDCIKHEVTNQVIRHVRIKALPD